MLTELDLDDNECKETSTNIRSSYSELDSVSQISGTREDSGTVHSKDYTKRGILAKKGMGKLFKPWSLRNIYVDLSQTLTYFDGTTLKGEIKLDGVTVRAISPEEADGRPFAFEISNISGVRRTQGNVLILAACSQAEASEWIDCLKAAASSTVRARTLNGPGYMSLVAEIKTGTNPTSDMDNIRRLREIRQAAKEKKQTEREMVPEASAEDV